MDSARPRPAPPMPATTLGGRGFQFVPSSLRVAKMDRHQLSIKPRKCPLSARQDAIHALQLGNAPAIVIGELDEQISRHELALAARLLAVAIVNALVGRQEP